MQKKGNKRAKLAFDIYCREVTGYIGRYAAMTLEDEIDITLFEESRPRCEEAATLLNKALIINGDATDIELLKEEGLNNTDAFISVTESSETNVLTCLHANSRPITPPPIMHRRSGLMETVPAAASNAVLSFAV